ncbi:hypothetical protein SESBI_30346 [Sesbania bispinosa]|nr:hypothetical protein SESBI_30346 [Sesbania bispinosa]
MPCSVATSLCNSSSVAASLCNSSSASVQSCSRPVAWERPHMVVIQYCSFLFRLARVLLRSCLRSYPILLWPHWLSCE